MRFLEVVWVLVLACVCLSDAKLNTEPDGRVKRERRNLIRRYHSSSSSHSYDPSSSSGYGHDHSSSSSYSNDHSSSPGYGHGHSYDDDYDYEAELLESDVKWLLGEVTWIGEQAKELMDRIRWFNMQDSSSMDPGMSSSSSSGSHSPGMYFPPGSHAPGMYSSSSSGSHSPGTYFPPGSSSDTYSSSSSYGPLDMYYYQDGNPIMLDYYGYPIVFDQNSYPITYDKYGYPIKNDEYGIPMYDQYGPIEYDQGTNPIVYDQYGNPLIYYPPAYMNGYNARKRSHNSPRGKESLEALLGKLKQVLKKRQQTKP